MIGRLRGIVINKQPPYLLLEVHGIGYEIAAPLSTFQLLPDVQREVVLYTHLSVREDAHTLYGFYAEHDRRLFRALIKVNGVGPKLALTILSGIAFDEFIHCILNQEVERLMKIPGIGRKTAERLIIDIKDTLTSWKLNMNLPQNQQFREDAISALITLGYKPKEAKRAVDAIKQLQLTSEALIRMALKNMTGGIINGNE